MASKQDRIAGYLSEHPGVSLRSVARDLGVSYSWVSRVRTALATQHVADHDRQHVEQHVASLPDGFYQVQDGRPYRIACQPGDVFQVDHDGVLQPGSTPRRTVLVRSR